MINKIIEELFVNKYDLISKNDTIIIGVSRWS